MGRLIDEDVLLARISLNYNNHQNITAGAMKDIINTTPTAFDIEKVVAELEKATKYVTIDGKSTGLEALHPIQAIDIVQKGGVE